jgi:hypothetical protein
MLVDLFSFFLVLLFSVFFLSYDRMIAKKEQALFFFYASGIYATTATTITCSIGTQQIVCHREEN